MSVVEIKEIRREIRRVDTEIGLLQAKCDAAGAVRDDNLLAQARRKRASLDKKLERFYR